MAAAAGAAGGGGGPAGAERSFLPAGGPRPPLLGLLPVPELPGLPGAARLCTPLAAAPGPGRTRRPHEEGRERSDQEQV